MAAITGHQGAFTLDANAYDENIFDFSINQNRETFESTDFDTVSNTRTKTAGLMDWDISASGYLDDTTLQVMTDWQNGSFASIGFTGVANTGVTYTGEVIVTNFNLTVSRTGGNNSYTLSAEGTGPLTVA